jgi:arylsulfatase
MATILEVTGAAYPKTYDGHDILPCEGESLVPSFAAAYNARGPLFWEHEGNAAVRVGKWKLVRKYPGPWELYDMEIDRTEMNDLAARHPERVTEMTAQYQQWASRCGVIPREKILELMKAQGETAFWEEEDEKAG